MTDAKWFAWRSGLFALTVALLPTGAGAEPASQPSQRGVEAADPRALRAIPWSAIASAVDRHPLVIAARHGRQAARSGIDAAGAAPNPNLELTTGHGRARDGSASRIEWGIGLSVPLGWLARRRAAVAAAQANASAVATEAEALRQEMLVELHERFWALVFAQERVSALTELTEQTGVLAETVQRRVQAGQSRPVEALRVDLEAERVAAELSRARVARVARREQLALWLALPEGHSFRASADLATPPRPPQASDVRQRARALHPSVAAARARVEALAADVSEQRAQRAPDLSLGVFADNELDRSAYGLSLSVDLPVWNWNTAGIRRAESALAAGRQRLEAQRMRLESEAVELQASCEASAELASRYRDRIRPRAAEAARTTERSYELGESSLLEVLDARRAFLETRTQWLATLTQAQNDCSRLALLLGKELP